MNTSRIRLKPRWRIETILRITLLMTVPTCAAVFAEDQQIDSAATIAEQAEEAWRDGIANRALEILDQGIHDHPQALTLQKLRGDILATVRRPQEAVNAYDSILQETPAALNVRWSKWSVLQRSGKRDQAIADLQRIARQDANNPLVYLRLALELRKLDRLEESVEAYQKAVELAPNLPGWRLAMARAKFDVLDYKGAHDEVRQVLKMVSPGSPEDAAAQSLLSIVYGATKERGRRFEPIFSPDGTSAERKEWAAIRAEAWRLFEAGRYAEAEPLYRKILTLKPNDYRAIHEFGSTLMDLGKYQEAINTLQKGIEFSSSDELYADSMFRIGICLTKLEKWSDALLHFELLYDAALSFEKSTEDAVIVPGTKVLDRKKLEEWIDEVRQHVPGTPMPRVETIESIPPAAEPQAEDQKSVPELVQQLLKPSDPIYTRASLMGRDADFSLFRFVIPASRVMRDDMLGGAHEYIPIDPGDTFSKTQKEIYLVFALVTASFDEVPLTAECFLETSKITGNQKALTRDHVVMAMNDQSGYFVLSPPKTGWPPGLHRCGFFVGGEVSAYTQTDEIRFRIVEPAPTS